MALIFLASAVLDATLFRMEWLLWNPGIEQSTRVAHLYQFLLLAPFLVRDLIQTGRVHPVFLMGIPVIAAFQAVAAALW